MRSSRRLLVPGIAKVAPSAAAADWQDAVDSLSPWAWWKLDEDSTPPEPDAVAADASGNSRTGIYNGGATFPTRRQAGPDLTGEDDLYAVEWGAGRNIRNNVAGFGTTLNGDWTIVFFHRSSYTAAAYWLHLSAGGFSGSAILMNYDAPGTGAARAGYISIYHDTGGADGNAVAGDAAFDDGVWHMIGLVKDDTAGTVECYVDGVSAFSGSYGGTPPSLGINDTFEWLGYPTGAHPTSTRTDEYLFWDSKLDADDFTTLNDAWTPE